MHKIPNLEKIIVEDIDALKGEFEELTKGTVNYLKGKGIPKEYINKIEEKLIASVENVLDTREDTPELRIAINTYKKLEEEIKKTGIKIDFEPFQKFGYFIEMNIMLKIISEMTSRTLEIPEIFVNLAGKINRYEENREKLSPPLEKDNNMSLIRKRYFPFEQKEKAHS